MKYKKIELDGYNLHLIKTDKFKTINIRVDFKRNMKKEEVTIRNVLTKTLINSTKNYPSRKDLEIKTEELYNLSGGINNIKSGNAGIMSFNINLLNENYTEVGMLKESIEFLKELIFNPHIENDRFDVASFSLSKRIIKNDIESIKDDPNYYSILRLTELINSESPISFRSSGYIEEIDKITPENLYEYYKDVIDNDVVNIFVIGDVDEKILDEFEYFKPRENKKVNHFLIEESISNPQKLKESLPVNDSILRIAYTFDGLTDFELRYVLNMYSFILGGSAESKLFSKLREKESLCYYANSSHDILSGLLIITSGIDKKNYEKALELINEEIENIKKGNFDDEDLVNGKKITKNSYIELFDSPNLIVSLYANHEYMDSDLIEERMKSVDKITKEDIVKVANKIKLHTVFLLEGEENE